MYKVIVLLIFYNFLQASELTKPQLEKLNSFVVIEHNNTFYKTRSFFTTRC